MAIVKMSEFTLFLMNDDLEAFLTSMQHFKHVNFAKTVIDKHEGFKRIESTYDFDENASKRNHIQTVIKQVQELKRKDKKRKGGLLSSMNVKNMTFEEICVVVEETDLDEILETFSEMYERKKEPVEGFSCVIPWERSILSIESMYKLQNQKPIIGTVPIEEAKRFKEGLKNIGSVYFMTQERSDKQQVIFVIVPPNGFEESVNILSEKHDLTPRSAVSLDIKSSVDKMLVLMKKNIDKRLNFVSRIKTIGPFEDILKIHYEYLSNEALKEEMKERFIQSQYVTAVRGWVETDCEEAFKTLLDDVLNQRYDLQLAAAPRHSREVPIKLKNNRFVQAFEPITSMYSQPRYDELDPTPIFAPFYAFFFGMMLADFGYGLVMAIGMGLALKFINFKPNTKGMIQMLFLVSFPTMFWGLIYGSFFGGLIPMPAIIDITKDFTTVLVMALGFGIAHLFIGLGVKAYIYIRDYKIRYVFYDVIFWYMTLIGVVVMVSMMFTDLLAPYQTIAMWAALIGAIGIVLTNGRDAKTFFGKGASGLYSLYGLTGYIGDVVSYSRLMALGLAGASIGMAFNTMVEMLQGLGPIGSIFGIFIFIFGHTFNLMISGLSSYVHSARLTYVEFFGKFFVGGGIAFKPFRAQAEYINVE